MNHKHHANSDHKVFILTALGEEFQAVRSHLKSIRHEMHPRTRTAYEIGYFVYKQTAWEVCLAEVGKGNPNAAAETAVAIEYFKPSIALFVGIAGGIKKDVKIGDVVAAEKVYYYESGKDDEDGLFKSRPVVKEGTRGMVQAARKEARSNRWLKRLPKIQNRPSAFRKRTPKVFVQPIAVGEKVVAAIDSSTYDTIHKRYNDAHAVEMEGVGFLTATSSFQTLEALVVRGISDLLANKAAADAKGSHDWASMTASAFAFQVLSTFVSSNGLLRGEPLALHPSTPLQIDLPKKLPKQIVE
jgi:nucleoside phosphorylase